MGEVEDDVRTLLRSSEELKATLVVQPSLETAFGEAGLSPEVRQDEGMRILAVISHRDEWDASLEEGSLFVCQYKTIEDGVSKELDIQRVFPITEDFSITIAQVRRAYIGSSAGSIDQPPSTGFSLTIHPAGPDLNDNLEPLVLLTGDIKELSIVSKLCKEFQQKLNADATQTLTSSQFETRFRWLLPYTLRRDVPIIYLIPKDLRSLNKPLHMQLSAASAGAPGDDAADLRLIRDEWMRYNARTSSRQGRRRLKIRIGTFNVNGKLPSQDLSSWIGGLADIPSTSSIPPLKPISPLSLGEVVRSPFEASLTASMDTLSTDDTLNGLPEAEPVDSDPYPDIFALGFQELDLSTEALIYSTSSVREDAWCLAIFAALGEKAELYEKLVSKQLVGMLTVVIVKKILASCFSGVHTSSAGAGLMGVMGNKGGTAVRLIFTPPALDDVAKPGATSFTFVNSHLAAFDEMFEKRNADFQDLSKRLTFDSEVLDTTGLAPLPITAYESDVLFWMGDLNYRVDLPDADVRTILNSEHWEDRFGTLLRYDQLKNAIRNRIAFDGFSEHPITHLPTYRFSHGIATDDMGYDMKRKPAWTDRILFMQAPTVGLQQLSYTSHPQINMSDHKPVAADFLLDIDFYDKDSYDAAARKLSRSIDTLQDSQERTIIKLDNVSIDMGDIKYKQPTSQTIRIQNTSKIPCAFRFVPIDVNSEINPHWLRVEPMQALIMPQEITYITLTAYVDNKSAAKLNLADKDLEATLILHTISGKDHFISVAGRYQYTCFSNKISTLTCLPGPIRSLVSLDDLRSENHPISAPREVMRLVNWMISDHTNDIDTLFIEYPADERVTEILRECLDTGEDFPFSPEDADRETHLAFAITLLHLLDSLTDPVVPTSLHSRCGQMTNRDEAFELLDAFPPASINVWISVTAFLHFICQSTSEDETSSKAGRIASAFAPVLLREELDSPYTPVSPLAKRNFLLYFIS